ncbi:MAG: cell division protein FtsZ [Rikenellaceae bacterium]
MNDGIVGELNATPAQQSIITVVGVGGAGCNAVNYMWDIGIRNVGFMICNTDQQAIDCSPIENKIRLGDNGLGAGNDPEQGRLAAVKSIDVVRKQLEALNTKMLFITAGMGGGTGTGAAPVIAKLAREMDILTVAIVTSPLLVEGQMRYDQAMRGIDELRKCVDSLLIINNENIQNLYLEDDPSAMEAFSKANEILGCAAKGIAEIITVTESYIHVDFADVSKVMRNSGRAHMSVETASGDDRAVEVAKLSLSSPLLDHNHITGAKNILLNMAVANFKELKYSEVTKILNYIQNNARVIASDGEVRTANIIWGMSEKPELGDALELVMVATGFDTEEEEFEEYNRAKLLMHCDPGSPFERMQSGTKRKLDSIKGISAAPMSSKSSNVVVSGEKVILPEREPRYPNIAALLKVPAYLARNAKMIAEAPAPKKRVNHKSNERQSAEQQEIEIERPNHTLFD